MQHIGHMGQNIQNWKNYRNTTQVCGKVMSEKNGYKSV